MKILVTGATGFTGGHLARRLASLGHEVRALIRSESDAANLLENGIEPVVGQLSSRQDVLGAARECEQIYHLAAVFRTAGHHDKHYMDINVGGTLNVIAAARAHGCSRLIHCSTGGVHGHVAHPPANEDYRYGADDIYQRSKLAAEQEIQAASASGMPTVIVRPGAIYGEGDERFLKLFRAIQRGVFVMVGPGTTRLHLVHVDDLVDGFVLCGSVPEAAGKIFLLGGPEAPTLWEIVRMAAGLMGVPVPRWSVPVWPVYLAGALCELACRPLGIDPPLHRRRVGFFTHHREFDITRARKVLGYQPLVVARDGIGRTLDWYVGQGLLEPFAETGQ